MPPPASPLPGALQVQREEQVLRAFTRGGAGPTATFPLVLTALTVSVLSMSLDAVARYSHDAFFVGMGLTVILATLLGKLLTLLSARWRLAANLVLPTTLGALIGVVVQALVLRDVGTSWSHAVRDLGGLVDTTEPLPWIASGVVLGGVPALLVSVFLLLATRSIRRLAGHDASEGFGVAFTGFSGLIAAFGLMLVGGVAAPPLFFVVIASALTLLVTLIVDGSRIRFLRRVYAGQGGGFDIVPLSHFASDPSIVPMVANVNASAVLVRVASNIGSYRATAAEPIALVAETEVETLRPLVRRRAAAVAILVAMLFLAGSSALAHA
ncbi:MAG: hypothetical protein K0S65_771 [Labilithrix sp.]|nr:hypothetical protein [Labilithrix sp.]